MMELSLQQLKQLLPKNPYVEHWHTALAQLLPDYEIKVSPESHGNFKIFTQSSSVNRKLLKGTQLLVLK